MCDGGTHDCDGNVRARCYALTRGIYPPRRNKEVTYDYIYIFTERFILADETFGEDVDVVIGDLLVPAWWIDSSRESVASGSHIAITIVSSTVTHLSQVLEDLSTPGRRKRSKVMQAQPGWLEYLPSP